MKHHTETTLKITDQLTRLFGILDYEVPDTPVGSVVRTDTEGFWDVTEYQHGGSYQCRCGRSEPAFFSSSQFRRCSPLNPELGCHICQDALKGATTKAERLAAWLDSRRATISPDRHLVLPESCSHLYIKESQESNQRATVRTRHFVYQHFYRKPVPAGFCVTRTCRNELCLNPHHLCLTKNHHAKITPYYRALIVTLSLKGMSTSGIQSFLHEAHSLELSQRSIQRTAREARRSKNCVI